MNAPMSKTQIAIATHKSLFHNAKVKSVTDGMGKTENVIKKSTNIKLGKIVKTGRLKGMPIYTVTLEERATCSASCFHYSTCYGNHMPFATRYEANPALIDLMAIELEALNKKHLNGFLVRLHILGDFYSVEYVNFWDKWLSQFDNLWVYGYSERQLGTNIGNALQTLRLKWKTRFMVRISGDTLQTHMSALSFDDTAAQQQVIDKKAFICPTQIAKKGDTKSAPKGIETLVSDCGACGLCWTATKNVVFLTH
jgi:hypothetical protein